MCFLFQPTHMNPQTPLSQQYPQYYKNVEHLTEVDVYQVHDLFGITDHSGAIHHASKKLLLAGARNGGKPALQDVIEARNSLNRYIAIQEAKAIQPPPEVGLRLVVDNTAQAANEPMVAASVPTGPRWVVLYYYRDTRRRFKPMQYFAIAATKKDALEQFKSWYPKADAVWIEKVQLFNEGANAAHLKYWASR